MRGRGSVRTIRLRKPSRSFLSVLILATFFQVGAFIGFRLSGLCSFDSHTALSEYVRDFSAVLSAGFLEGSLLRTVGVYFCYILAAFLLGYSVLGVVFIPILSALFGFGTMFAINCFLCAFSRPGILPALALLGVRVAVTLVCFLVISVEALAQSAGIVMVTINRCGHGEKTGFFAKRYLVLFVVCALFLCLFAFFESLLTPALFRMAMEKVLQ